MWSSRNKMLLDADGDGEDDVAFLSGNDFEILAFFIYFLVGRIYLAK